MTLDNPQDQSQLLRLVAVMDQLRSPGGCPWDAEQTHESLVEYLIEECYETIEAIEAGNDEDLKEELGDLLFVLVNIAKFKKIDAEEALRSTNYKFIKRFKHIEAEVAKRGKTLKETPLEELERYWQDAKDGHFSKKLHCLFDFGVSFAYEC